MRIPSIRQLAALLLLAAPAGAQQLDFKHCICFGDSLTNNDFLGLVYGNPQSLYEEDPFEAVFNKARQAGDTLNSYALAGARSSQIDLQFDTYEFFELLGVAPSATLFSLEIGGNDFFANELLLGAHAPGTNALADQVVDTLVARIEGNLKRMRARAGVEVVLWTVPDITLTPESAGLSAAQKANIRAHLKRCNDRLLRFRSRSRVAVLDFARLQAAVLASPPVINGTALAPPPAFGDYADIHADTVHPTAVSNALIANAIIDLLNKKYSVNIPFYTEAELTVLARL